MINEKIHFLLTKQQQQQQDNKDLLDIHSTESEKMNKVSRAPEKYLKYVDEQIHLMKKKFSTSDHFDCRFIHALRLSPLVT